MANIKVTCLNCGKMCEKYPSQIRKRTFCSRDCFHEHWTENATGWINSDGYRVVCKNGKDIFEHRLVMETILGRPLTKDEIVHHINGNRAQNHPENLQLMKRNRHTSLHNTGKSRKGQKREPLSEETKRKISIAKMGKPLSQEHKNKIAKAMRKARKDKFWSSKIN